MNLAALAGYLAGLMIDPAIWGVVAVVLYVSRRLPWWYRPMAATGAVMVVSILLYSWTKQSPSNAQMAFIVGAAVIWSAVFMAINAWRTRSAARSPSSAVVLPSGYDQG